MGGGCLFHAQILYCREDVHPTRSTGSVYNGQRSSYIIHGDDGVHYPHRSANQCVPLRNHGKANLCLGRVQPVHDIITGVRHSVVI